ncbi:MAG: hypothetical protein V4621_08330 [Pseudomonadota bacterium]
MGLDWPGWITPGKLEIGIGPFEHALKGVQTGFFVAIYCVSGPNRLQDAVVVAKRGGNAQEGGKRANQHPGGFCPSWPWPVSILSVE